MFDTEKLITVIQPRECLWNSQCKLYLNKGARREAWEEIARLFHDDWDSFSAGEKDMKLDYLLKKWRNVRDYYMRSKKRDSYMQDHHRKSAKKSRYYYYDQLRFLDAVWKTRSCSISDKDDANGEDFDISNDITYESCFITEDSNEAPHIKEETTSPRAIPFPLHEPLGKADQDLNVTANQNFLLSLLPDMTSLNERQNMTFRIGVLNLINSLKFGATDGGQSTV
ncbi:unnamed protein product [Chrysodeixis includens]|uniref:MADF domain-containing protein n=1 Tax=Chrysodeixis includens TaxID=689277 RepID=A0A9P0BTW9_CHRIL|nr:unnamed protein product [Chrysodeixis includens]